MPEPRKIPTRLPVNGRGGAGRLAPSSAKSATIDADEDTLFKALVARGKNPPSKLKFASEDEEKALVEESLDDIYNAWAANGKYIDNIVEMWGNWRMVTEPKDFPFEGCSNIRVPLTSVFVETLLVRIVKAVLGGTYVSKLSYVDRQNSDEALNELNDWFRWELTHNIKLRRRFMDIIRNVLITGIDIEIPTYNHETRYLHSQREFDIVDQEQPLTELVGDALEKIINEPSDWGVAEKIAVTSQPKPGLFKLNDDGQIVFLLDIDKSKLVADVWKRETIYDGVKFNQIQLEDLIVPNTHAELNDLPFWAVRCWYDVDKYRERLEDKFFLDLGDEENKRIINFADVKDGELITHPLTDLQDSEENIDSTGEALVRTAPRKGFIEVYRVERWWVWGTRTDDDQVDRALQRATKVVVWIAARARRVVKIERLEDLNKDAEASGVKFGFIDEPNRFFPMGLAEWVRHSQTELDAIHNQRLDSGLLYNVPFGFYKPTSGMSKSAEPIRIEVGKFFPVADPQSIVMPRTNWQPSFSFAEENLVKGYAQEQAGLTGQAIGQPTSKRQSASEFVGVASALDLRTEIFVESILESLECLLYRTLGLYQQHGSAARIFRVAGEGGAMLTKRFEHDRLQGKIQLQMQGDLSLINEQLQRQVALDMLQLLMNAILIESHIVGPDTIYAAIDKLAKLMHYTDVPLHKPQLPPMSDTPEVEEHQMFSGQKPTGPTLGENLDEHLAHHGRLAANTEIMNQWSPESRQLLEEHIKATLQTRDAKQIIAKQQSALAVQMQQEMVNKGINPGKTGQSRANTGTGPGSEAEGVEGAGASPTAPQPMAA